MSDLVSESVVQEQRVTRPGRLLEECFDLVFDRAPVMAHSIGTDGRLVRVNRRWVAGMDYHGPEVFGRKSVEFLTKESRERAIEDTLPLFWRIGSARSVGYRFVRKNGQLLDLLLDAELIPGPGGYPLTLAVLHDPDDPVQGRQAVTTIRVLQSLAHLRRDLEHRRTDHGYALSEERAVALQQRGLPQASALAPEALGVFLETAQDISGSLRSLSRMQEEWLGEAVEQQRELLFVTKSIARSLADLVVATEKSDPPGA